MYDMTFEDRMDEKYGAQREPIPRSFLWFWMLFGCIAGVLFYLAVGVAIAKAVQPDVCKGFATECHAAAAEVTR